MLEWLSDRRITVRWTRLAGVTAVLVGGLASVVSATARPTTVGRSAAALITGAGSRPAYVSYIRSESNAVGATAVDWAGHTSAAIPAFARKYDLPCSACHTAWPELNAFGQRFKDRGYQLGNDRDNPIWKDPSYWPSAFRTTPGWRSERATNQITSTDSFATVTQSGFDIGEADFLNLGTLYKDISFGFVPTGFGGDVTLETAYVRFDNLFNSSWVNLKVGKFELDNLLSEKRILTLSSTGGFYQGYHFLPVGSTNDFGIGDNQIGAEIMGHNENSYRRYSIAVLNENDGEPGLAGANDAGGGKGMDFNVTASQAFDAGKLGVERIGVYGYFGQRPTAFTYASDGVTVIPGTGSTNKSFSRIGFVGDFFLQNFEVLPFFVHGSENQALITGATQNATWNSYLVEAHYYVNPQLMFLGRADYVKMSQQGDPATPKTQGNSDVYTIGLRYYPIMFSRAGLSWHTEFSFGKTIGVIPMSGIGNTADAPDPGTVVKTASVLTALDFDF
ncbi:MAG TPA: hypothetical protein VFI39_04460 [Gemmatimonadales bacterium]|nr:hypothetical protein [Gemmatimonadales bacterium]